MGRRSIWSTRFQGRRATPRGTFPLARLVNMRYQSVHGVTKYMMSPTHRAG
ncbi:MAG: hypothetical protein HY555_01560 [Euryarchaeota archaeon]|nr:hypothetical protein [Euryarchaeota archaeon]